MKSRAIVLAATGFAALVTGALSAEAAAPNYQAYCSKRLPGSFVNRFNATGELACTVRRTPSSMMHYAVHYGEACNMHRPAAW